MTLIDTSAWVEYFRATESGAHRAVRQLLEEDAELQTTDVVVMEVVAGARDDDHLEQLRRLMARCQYVPVEGLGDYETAARCTSGADERARRSVRSPTASSPPSPSAPTSPFCTSTVISTC